MTSAQTVPQKVYAVITYDEVVSFKYTSPEDGEANSMEHEMTFIWEDTLEKFIEEHGSEKAYKVNEFKQVNAKNIFINQVEGRADDVMEEVEEAIANKMKFGFEFTGQLHNDD